MKKEYRFKDALASACMIAFVFGETALPKPYKEGVKPKPQESSFVKDTAKVGLGALIAVKLGQVGPVMIVKQTAKALGMLKTPEFEGDLLMDNISTDFTGNSSQSIPSATPQASVSGSTGLMPSHVADGQGISSMSEQTEMQKMIKDQVKIELAEAQAKLGNSEETIENDVMVRSLPEQGK